jgi:hypothetical protein
MLLWWLSTTREWLKEVQASSRRILPARGLGFTLKVSTRRLGLKVLPEGSP